jgi:NAD(P)H-nitrite reductase large subunit
MRVLILGAGPAGLTAAERLRELAPAREPSLTITMVSAEPCPPYSPPAMADHFLTGSRERLFWKGEDVCERLGIEYLAGIAARQLDADARLVRLDDGHELEYDRLLISTGSALYAPIAGHDLPGVYNFKSLSAAEALVAGVRRGEVSDAVVVGAGFIGVEVALLLRSLGLAVTLVEQHTIMRQMLDAETAGLVREALSRRGIDVRLHTTAVAFAERAGRAGGVVTSDGEFVPAGVCIAATGVKPHTEFLAGSGIACNWGIPVDATLATNLPDVWAAGDVAATADRVTGKRYVHAIWPNATAQGRVVAERMLGYDTAYEGAEIMNSLRHLGVPLIAAGTVSGSEELRLKRPGVLRKIALEEDRIVGFRLTGDVRGAGFYRALMLRRADVGAFKRELVSPGFGIGRLAA